MKNLFLAAMMLLSITALQSQERPSLTATSRKVDSLENTVTDLQLAYKQLLLSAEAARQVQLTAQITADSTATTKTIIKAPNTVEEANALLVLLLGFVQFVLTGFIPKDKLPRWLSPFVLSILIGLVVTIVGLTLGNLSLPDGLSFFLGVTGAGNIIHQIKKPKTAKDEKTV